MISVGEAFPVALKEQLLATLAARRAVLLRCGMTEAFGAAVLRSEDQVAHAGAAGRPTPGVEVRLLDDDGNEVATGEIGEIVVRSGAPGQWLGMRAYWNAPQKTEETLRDGWLTTGDMGRFDGEGSLYVVGDRKKDIVISGGLNVSSTGSRGGDRARTRRCARPPSPALPDAALRGGGRRVRRTPAGDDRHRGGDRGALPQLPHRELQETWSTSSSRPLPRNAQEKVLMSCDLRARLAQLLPS